jgi:hypothetical protein
MEGPPDSGSAGADTVGGAFRAGSLTCFDPQPAAMATKVSPKKN